MIPIKRGINKITTQMGFITYPIMSERIYDTKEREYITPL